MRYRRCTTAPHRSVLPRAVAFCLFAAGALPDTAAAICREPTVVDPLRGIQNTVPARSSGDAAPGADPAEEAPETAQFRSPIDAIPVGEGADFYTREHVNKLAGLIIDQPAGMRKELERDFRRDPRDRMMRRIFVDVNSPILLAQLAGWTLNLPENRRARAAYEGARDMLLDIYEDARLPDDVYFQDRFIAGVANIYGIVSPSGDAGAGYLKADVMAYLTDRVGRAEKENKTFAAQTTAKHLTWLLYSCESGSALRYLSATTSETRPVHGRAVEVKLDRLLAAPLVYKVRGADAALAQALGRVAVQVAKAAEKGGRGSSRAQDQAYYLGRVLTYADVALWVHVRKAHQSRASVEHGAKIVRYSLVAIDMLTGGASKKGTDLLRQGVDWLESKEKAAELKAEERTYRTIRESLMKATITAFESELDLYRMAVRDEDLGHFAREFESNVIDGRTKALRGFTEVSLPSWMQP